MPEFRTVACRQCNGTGIDRGRQCPACKGTREQQETRYTAAERAELRELDRRTELARSRVLTRVVELCDGRQDAQLVHDAGRGLEHLREHEPDRFARLLSSVEHGRLDDVIRALSAYYQAASGQQMAF